MHPVVREIGERRGESTLLHDAPDSQALSYRRATPTKVGGLVGGCVIALFLGLYTPRDANPRRTSPATAAPLPATSQPSSELAPTPIAALARTPSAPADRAPDSVAAFLAAANVIAALPAGPARSELLADLFTKWTRADFDAALEWTHTLADVRLREQALLHLCSRWLEFSPADALAFAQRASADPVVLLSALVSRWVMRDPTAASAWAAQLPASEPTSRVLASLVAAWAAEDPDAAFAWTAQLSVGPARDAALRVLGHASNAP